jgi:hypothetical protein
MTALVRTTARRAAAAIAAGCALAAGAAAAPLAPPVSADALSCVAATDAAGIDRVLDGVGSPLAGRGAAFVADSQAVGLDPRALVAIAAHETLLETYPPARRIHNPFGLGPGWSFPTDRDAIAAAARVLGDAYLSRGLTRIPEIGARWAPVGAENDPTELNPNWPSGVAAYYAALGGDPSRPLMLSTQNPSPSCAALAGGSGPSVVMVWGGGLPSTSGPRMDQGGDPRTGLPATIRDFAFPLAVPSGATVGYHDSFNDPGTPGCYGRAWRCAVSLSSAPRVTVVAAAAGTLRPASAEDGRRGVAFWIDLGPRERLGYSGLASYLPGIAAGVPVRAGQPLGTSTGSLMLSWVRHGLRVNPFHLLRATRPSDA